MTNTINTNTKEFYARAMEYLSEFKNKRYIVVHNECIGIEISTPSFGIEDKALYIRNLLSGMGFKVKAYSNQQKIIIE